MAESLRKRENRELIELLNELRVALPGVQVLFAFLLAVPFAIGFKSVTEFQKDVYLVTLLSTTIATVTFITPSALHRMRFRQGDKEYTLMVSNRFAVVGLAFLALAMIGVVLLVTDYLYDAAVAIPVTVFVTLLFAGCWYGLPISRRYAQHSERYREQHPDESDD